MNLPMPDLMPVLPEIILASTACCVLLVELVARSKPPIGAIGISISVILLMILQSTQGSTFGGTFVSDSFSTWFKVIFLVNLILATLVSFEYIERQGANFGEYYSVLMFATVGMMIMASARDLIVLYVGLELMSLSTFILATMKRHDWWSNEAGIKYFMLGAFSSCIMLYGFALLYGLTASTDLQHIGAHIAANGMSPALMLCMVFIVAAFAFKIGAAPFHMWVSDVYEGAPVPVTLFMSVGPKAAGFAVIGRVFYETFGSVQAEWTPILIVLSVLSMAVGNIMALLQKNLKRMLAYSSIAHAGYALIGVIAGPGEGMNAMMTYMLIYAFMSIGAFGVIILMDCRNDLNDFNGLAKKHPALAALMLIFMFALTGIPPTAGFVGKFNVFLAAINAGYTWLVIVGVFFSVISAFYYLRVVMNMYMKPGAISVRVEGFPCALAALFIAGLAVCVLGIVPSLVIR